MFHLGVSFPLAAGESVRQVTLASFFDLTFRRDARLTMDTALLLDAGTNVPSSGLNLHGALRFSQLDAIRNTGQYLAPYSTKLFNADAGIAASDLTLLAANLASRNCTNMRPCVGVCAS